MRSFVGAAWGKILNANSLHRFLKNGPGAAFFNMPSLKKMHLARLRMYAGYQDWKNPDVLKNIQTMCLFIGHTKSGNSMLGSLIDAHSNAILADEVDALHYVTAGFKRDQLFHILIRASQKEFYKGRITARRMDPYSWQIADQWQGSFTTLKLIGDSTSGTSTRRLADSPDLYIRLQRLMEAVNIKFVHTIRNPFDPIYIMMVRGKKTFEQAFYNYELGWKRLEHLYKQVGSENIFPVRYEDFINNPEHQLTTLCDFLGLNHEPGYVEACRKILDHSPQKIRHNTEWQPDWISRVNGLIDRTHLLHGYSFND